MRIFQLVPGLYYGDAVGNDILALDQLFHKMGLETQIYSTYTGPRIPEGVSKNFYEMPKPEKEDILIYHMATGYAPIREYLMAQDCRKVMIYHNLTPADYFVPYSERFVVGASGGFEDLSLMKDTFECCIADSEFNKQDLRKAGYTCPIAVLPILVPFEDYEQEPDPEVLSQYQEKGWTNLLFVGRIAPNKCQEDVIRAFVAYKEKYNPKSRLFIVGNYEGMDLYYDRLKRYTGSIDAKDVIFTGHIPFRSILAYYHLSDLFLCMSEHEGFCVPLLEAMKFDKPIVAFDSTAIPYTLNGAGILFPEKDPALVAAIIDEVMENKDMREKLLAGQRARLEHFQYDNVARLAKEIMGRLTERESIDGMGAEERNTVVSLESMLPRLEEKIKAKGPLEFRQSFSSISVQVSTPEKIRRKVFFRGYQMVGLVSPRFADRVKKFIKKHILK